jgi:hypothetical protein
MLEPLPKMYGDDGLYSDLLSASKQGYWLVMALVLIVPTFLFLLGAPTRGVWIPLLAC